MLSKSKSKLIEKKEILLAPELVPPKAVRLKFCKVGTLQYISHLDLQRTFNRIIVRACIPVWYTQGFNPHIKLVFSTPLSVGSESICEYLDIKLSRDMPLDEIKERLNAEMTDEFYISDVYEPKSDFASIEYACYSINIHTKDASEDLAKKIETVLTSSPLNMVKKTKSGEKEIDIVPLIRAAEAKYNDTERRIELNTVLSASSTNYLNPEMLITALKREIGILSGDMTEEYYSILRTSLKNADMSEFF